MKYIEKIAHLLIPRESNNHKAKILHPSSLFIIVLLFSIFQLSLTFIPKISPQILGYAANISPEEVIRLTNIKRQEAGVEPLVANATLSAAAQAKGNDMLAKDYWAHVAPDGTQPWAFFNSFGYKYRYAGENLARDFQNPSSAVDAWMNSPTHKENLLSNKYKEIGIAVVEGDLGGVDTTIIVQFFGTQMRDSIAPAPIAQAKKTEVTITPTQTPVVTSTPNPVVLQISPIPEPPTNKVLVSPFNSTKKVSLVIVGVLLVVLVIDGFVIARKRIAKVGGRTFAHLAFLGMIMAIVLILKAGSII